MILYAVNDQKQSPMSTPMDSGSYSLSLSPTMSQTMPSEAHDFFDIDKEASSPPLLHQYSNKSLPSSPKRKKPEPPKRKFPTTSIRRPYNKALPPTSPKPKRSVKFNKKPVLGKTDDFDLNQTE